MIHRLPQIRFGRFVRGLAALVLIALAFFLGNRAWVRDQVWVRFNNGTVLDIPDIRYGTNITYRMGGALRSALWSWVPTNATDSLSLGRMTLSRPPLRDFSSPSSTVLVSRVNAKIHRDVGPPLHRMAPGSAGFVRLTVEDPNTGILYPSLIPTQFETIDTNERNGWIRTSGFQLFRAFPRVSERLHLRLETGPWKGHQRWREVGVWAFDNPAVPDLAAWSTEPIQRSVELESTVFRLDSLRVLPNPDWVAQNESPFVIDCQISIVGDASAETRWRPLTFAVEDDTGNATASLVSVPETTRGGGFGIQADLLVDPSRRWRISIEIAEYPLTLDASPILRTTFPPDGELVDLTNDGRPQVVVRSGGYVGILELSSEDDQWAIVPVRGLSMDGADAPPWELSVEQIDPSRVKVAPLRRPGSERGISFQYAVVAKRRLIFYSDCDQISLY